MRLIADESERLDRFLARQVPEVSRTRLAKVIDLGQVLVDGEAEKPSFKLEPGMEVVFELPPETPPHDLTPADIELDIPYEDDDLLVVNKPRGLATHPANTLLEPSLVNALLAHKIDLSIGTASFRPGIVHRLDKETTGLLIVAKNDAAHASLAAQIAKKTALRAYLAVVGHAPKSESFDIDGPIGRDRRNRLRMAVDPKGKAALTHVRQLRKAATCTLLSVHLSTGRTHQIRVHLAAVGLPILGDKLYGGGEGAMQLHSAGVVFIHPASGETVTVTAPPPADFRMPPTESELSSIVQRPEVESK